jgi:hypothetical protein
VQENILDQYPDANVQVFVVWVPRVATGERFGVAELVVDGRADHYWDEGLVVPAHFGDASAYDVFYAYGPDASWGDPPVETGRPVLYETARLERALEPYL